MPKFSHISLKHIISLEDWDIAVEPLTGSRAKNTVFNPISEFPFVFKEPKQHREAQIWSELLASYIAGDLLGWPVQQVSIAERHGKLGNLMKYIYDDETETFTEGWQLCRELDSDYDVKKGERHTLELLFKVASALESRGLASNAFFDFWGQAFALDALISNTDRHAENWAIIEDGDGCIRMAPLYDNATSMGCEWAENSLDQKWFDEKGNIISTMVAKYIGNGRHHVRLASPSSKGAPFGQICLRFLELRPEQLHAFKAVASLDLQPVFTVLEQIASMETLKKPYIMTENRARQVYEILLKGQERIRNILVKGVN